MKLSKLNIKKINLSDIDENYSSQDILMKLGELYQYEISLVSILKKLQNSLTKLKIW